MKNILIVAYVYPPLGGAGVQRTLKFAKFLKKFGYNVNVLTVNNEKSTIKDESLEAESTDGIKVFRAMQRDNFIVNTIANRNITHVKTMKVENKEDIIKITSEITLKSKVKRKIKKTLLNIYRNMYIPDDKISWKKDAVELGLKIIKEEKIDIIYSTSAPYTGHLIACELKQKSNIAWIADFRDQWVTNPFADYTPYAKRKNERMETTVIEKANVVISVSKPIIDDFIDRYKNQRADKFKIITNGYDEDDFDDYNIDRIPPKYIITYNGTLYGKISPKNFLIAIDRLIEDKKIKLEELIIRFVGQIGKDAQEDITFFLAKYDKVIEFISYLPHKESLKELENSSAALLIIGAFERSEGVYTGKIFEYIRSGRVVIGIVPDGVAKDLILDTNTGFCCHPEQIDEIKAVIYKSYGIWKGTQEKLDIHWEKVKKYNRENLTRELMSIIESL
ncbi:glycosyltransferase [Clostridium sp. CF011]|uniref:glycosyltransferase n=1 Tax=Clostridium sp. CF011 TaxID=2843318 RepID=UPI001C0CDC78|nr:glycosyltransferase [Clostridium sp. CF011]MBU3093628.1 glycosyltransferase [Clostridium sp. CF011]WAG70693.1 glycosyltransferase [Clostridium sp. CF011]